MRTKFCQFHFSFKYLGRVDYLQNYCTKHLGCFDHGCCLSWPSIMRSHIIKKIIWTKSSLDLQSPLIVQDWIHVPGELLQGVIVDIFHGKSCNKSGVGLLHILVCFLDASLSQNPQRYTYLLLRERFIEKKRRKKLTNVSFR